jgi:hypothetical protein
MNPHGAIASNGKPRFRCLNRDCESYGKTSVERILPKSADVLRSCEEVFPGLAWEVLKSDENQVHIWARTKHFTSEILVLREVGVTCWFVDRKRGEMFRCDRSESKNGQPVKEALVGLREKIEQYGCKIQEVLGEKS